VATGGAIRGQVRLRPGGLPYTVQYYTTHTHTHTQLQIRLHIYRRNDIQCGKVDHPHPEDPGPNPATGSWGTFDFSNKAGIKVGIWGLGFPGPTKCERRFAWEPCGPGEFRPKTLGHGAGGGHSGLPVWSAGHYECSANLQIQYPDSPPPPLPPLDPCSPRDRGLEITQRLGLNYSLWERIPPALWVKTFLPSPQFILDILSQFPGYPDCVLFCPQLLSVNPTRSLGEDISPLTSVLKGYPQTMTPEFWTPPTIGNILSPC